MARVLVVGGGISGCTAALELAKRGQEVVLVEKAEGIGGKVREYGCKSTENCSDCGVCLSGGLWEMVENNPGIEIFTRSYLVDVSGNRGNFKVTLKSAEGFTALAEISCIIVAIGFERPVSQSYGNLEFQKSGSIVSGYQLEKFISSRDREGIMCKRPYTMAFIQCFGSRDIQEKALYCSRVCCAYSTRAARTLKYLYPDAQIAFFYMDLQYIEEGQYLDELSREGFEFIKCRPTKIKSGNPPKIFYEDPETSTIVEREFDIIFLSEGIHPAADVGHLAEICTLGVDEWGFLKCIREGAETGIYVAGCAAGPKGIQEVFSESLAIASQLVADMG